MSKLNTGVVLAALLLLPAPARAQSDFSCTEVLGFSQTLEWFAAISTAELGGSVGSVELDDDEFLPSWQGRFTAGAALERWRDPEFDGWEGTTRAPAVCERHEVDRVLFNVSGSRRTAGEWASGIIDVIEVLRTRYPDVQRVVLLPPAGPPLDGCDGVRAARIQPSIVEGIDLALREASGEVVAGPVPRVADCDQYADGLGHLTPEGAEHVHTEMRSAFSRQASGSTLRP